MTNKAKKLFDFIQSYIQKNSASGQVIRLVLDMLGA